MRKYVIIVAGGSGKRMNTEIPKQFLLLNGLPVLMRTIYAFHNFENSIDIILVLPVQHIELWKTLCGQYNFTIEYKIAKGGKTRYQSVKNGLACVNVFESLIAVHDGVRPLVSRDLIQRCYETAAIKGNAIPVIEINDSMRIIIGQNNKPLARSEIRIVQTPQVFKFSQIFEAYQSEFKDTFTDDASVVEANGNIINLVHGISENIKITRNQDLTIASALLTSISCEEN